MNPKQKAKELVEKFCSQYDSVIPNQRSKESAIKCCDEIINNLEQIKEFDQEINESFKIYIKYWKEVKECLNIIKL